MNDSSFNPPNKENVMSTYNGNDSRMKIESRNTAMTSPTDKPINLMLIAFPEEENGEFVCKDVEILRKKGIAINSIIWVNDNMQLFCRIKEYMDKHFKGRHLGICYDLHDDISLGLIKHYVGKMGKLDLIFLDYCNLLSPTHKTFWKRLVNSNVLANKCRVSITLQVHGRGYIKFLKDKFGILPENLVRSPKENKGWIETSIKSPNGYSNWWGCGIMFLSSASASRLQKIFGTDARHFTKEGNDACPDYLVRWKDIPIEKNEKDEMFFKSIFAISVASVIDVFFKSSKISNGSAYVYNANGPNKMAFVSFVRTQESQVKFAKNTNEKKQRSIAIRAMLDDGYNTKEIAKKLNLSVNQVAGVAAWHNNPDSWK